MDRILDLDRYPLDTPDEAGRQALVAACRRDLADHGMFNLDGFVRSPALSGCVAEIAPLFETDAFTHQRDHNIYFDDDIADIAPDHPALGRLQTTNRTICADRILGSMVLRIYQWSPLLEFLAATMGMPRLYPMADPLARVNVLAYGEGEALNWHFDRAEFTTTLLLQAPESGGAFQYRRDLRAAGDPNYAGVARLLAGEDEDVRTLPLAAGTLSVFKGKYTAHRVTPAQGPRPRMVAVFSYYERPGVRFDPAERRGFYGRAGAVDSPG